MEVIGNMMEMLFRLCLENRQTVRNLVIKPFLL